MTDSKKGNQPSVLGFPFYLEDCPKTAEESENMRKVPYNSTERNLMYVILCIRPDIYFTVGLDLRKLTLGCVFVLDDRSVV
ncbi:gag/pol protein [Gossypium australe]|uniref:Gag/pol protein n=1 Tax=Gossypium australe TaxID=47621 RepID=A0A5B6VLT9_9ROSI|nr:gag/pol protein [Gossypium australe]